MTTDASGPPASERDGEPHDESMGFYGLSDLTLGPGDEIGPYRLDIRLGAGGFGEVFRAHQSAPVRRDVAIKIIKLGMDTREVLARFDAERQTLAQMDHANIATVFDAGVTAHGRPFFVMELVDGERITDHCDARKLPIGERLGLFLEVCDAVTHAHRRGIIHRDLKPSNVLVSKTDDGASVRVIDFGVAKAIGDGADGEPGPVTRDDQLIGTPEYMSPEQAELGSSHVDTRADVYSLGILLYELLVGAAPVDRAALREARRRRSHEEIRRMLLEQDMPSPSLRLGQLDGAEASRQAAGRSTTVPALRSGLRGDLDWIAMRAIDRDRERRYGSAAELAEDVRRHLRHEPVRAGPPSVLYRLRKLARRRRALVAGGSVAAIGLVVGLSAALWQAGEARAEQERKDEALRLFEFIPMSATPAARRGGDASLVDVMRQWLEEYERSGANDPEIDAFVRHTLGRLLYSIGSYAEAVELLRGAVELRVGALGADDPDTLATRQSLALALWYAGETAEAESGFKAVLAIRRRDAGDADPATLQAVNNLGLFLVEELRWDEAEPLLTAALETRRRLLGEGDRLTLVSKANLALLRRYQGRYEEAAVLFEEADRGLTAVEGPDHPYAITVAVNRCLLLADQGRAEEADAHSRAAVEHAERIYDPDHPETVAARDVRADVLFGMRRFDEAEALHRQNLEILTLQGGRSRDRALRTTNDLALCLQKQSRFAEAEALYQEALAGQRTLHTEEHRDTLKTLSNLGTLYYAQRRFDEAAPIFSRALEIAEKVLPPDHPDTLRAAGNLAATLADLKRYDEALVAYETVLEIQMRTLEPRDPVVLFTRYNRGTVLMSAERYEDARRELGDLLEIYREQQSIPDVVWTRNALARAIMLDGEPQAAEPLFREMVAEARLPAAGSTAAQIAWWQSNHAECLTALQRFEEAETLLLESLDTLRRVAPEAVGTIDAVREKAAAMYDAWGRPDDAAAYRH